jgi:23S rRNA pseudouridine2457 synthase
MTRVVLLNKPYDVLCQFTDGDGRATLADFVRTPGVYPCGRLDRDSEGLVVLTDDGPLQHALSHPTRGKEKGYWAQVEGAPTPAVCAILAAGVHLDGALTAPARCQIIGAPPVWPREPPIRVRAQIPDTWLELHLTEGKNRQVRRMTAAVGHPTLRLIRFAVGPLVLGTLAPGEARTLSPAGLSALRAALDGPRSAPRTISDRKKRGRGGAPLRRPG